MQSSLQKLINKPINKRRYSSSAEPSNLDSHHQDVSCCDSRYADDGSVQQPKLKQPSLLSRLAQSSSVQSAAPTTSQQHAAASKEASQIPQSSQEHSTNCAVSSWTSDQQTGLCPVCGLELPVQLLQQHVGEELSLLTDSNDNCMAPTLADSRNQLSTLADRPAPVSKRHRQRSTTSRQHPAGQQKVSAAHLVARCPSSVCYNQAFAIRRLPSLSPV